MCAAIAATDGIIDLDAGVRTRGTGAALVVGATLARGWEATELVSGALDAAARTTGRGRRRVALADIVNRDASAFGVTGVAVGLAIAATDGRILVCADGGRHGADAALIRASAVAADSTLMPAAVAMQRLP